jgi:hypothetical protein
MGGCDGLERGTDARLAQIVAREAAPALGECNGRIGVALGGGGPRDDGPEGDQHRETDVHSHH